MSNFMSKFLKSSLMSAIFLTILGILLFVQSELTIISISYVIGAILIAIGVIGILKFMNNMKKGQKNELDMVYGIVAIILGIIVISNPKAVASIIPFVLGIIIVISSATKLQYSLELKKEGNHLWSSTMIISLLTLLCGIVLVFNPFQGAEILVKIVGAILFIYGILDIISTIRLRSTIKEIKKVIEDPIIDAEVIEDHTKSTDKKNQKEEE